MILLDTPYEFLENELSDVIRMFFGKTEIAVNRSGNEYEYKIVHIHSQIDGKWLETAEIQSQSGITEQQYEYRPPMEYLGDIEFKRHVKRAAKLCVYYLLKKFTGTGMPWGALTGIRPVKLYRQLSGEFGCENAGPILVETYDVMKSKINLLEDIIEAQKPYYKTRDEASVDLYVGFPFCPTRCLYCSFISFDLSRGRAPLDEYIDCLKKELDWFYDWAGKRNKRIRSIYIGGGTPTSIGLGNLKRVMELMQPAAKGCMEFTCEAGRPDTMDHAMLEMLKSGGITRISINPQTMNDETLVRMNRKHNGGDIIRSYEMARELGFYSINMDIILGLPGETATETRYTMDALSSLQIQNLTIHTLAIKRSSKLNEHIRDYKPADENEIHRMIDIPQQCAYAMGMRPYYMYRQKYMAGNLENVGFSLPGYESVYNIDIMEETHNLLALGAGAVSKRMYYERDLHVRYANPKSVSYYIENIDRLISERDTLFDLG